MNQLERHNLAQIETLNQRGGRMLSIVDLLLAGTMDLEMATLLCAVVGRGAGFLSGAVPGGAGKTTVMAALLAFLPPEVEIVTVEDEGVIADAPPAAERRQCYLAHEIGAGHFYGYIWGQAARDYLGLARRGHLIATGLHADTLPQLRGMLLSAPIDADEQSLAALDFTLFVATERRGSSVRRRVSAVHAGAATDAPVLFEWDPYSDRFIAHAACTNAAPTTSRSDLVGQASPPGPAQPGAAMLHGSIGRTCGSQRLACSPYKRLLQDLAERKVRRMEEVRAAYLDLLSAQGVRR